MKRPNILQKLPLLATASFMLASSGCYFFFEENLPETDIEGKVIIEAQAVGLDSFADLSDEELTDFIGRLGVVYIGAYGGLENRGGITFPTFDPFSQNAFPYGGTTVGAYTFGGIEVLTCEMITNRFETAQDIINRFDLRVPPVGVYPEIASRALVYEAAILNDEISDDEAAALQLVSSYPQLSESEYIAYLLEQNYFRYYNGPPNEGCGEPDADGNYPIEPCDISDFDFYGDVPWVVNGDGDLEAPFKIYKVFTPVDESTGEYLLPSLWALIDQNGSTCEPADGYYAEEINPDGVYAGVSQFDTLNFTCEYVSQGDLYTQYDSPADAPKAVRDGSEVVIRINASLPRPVDTSELDETLDYPFCGY